MAISKKVVLGAVSVAIVVVVAGLFAFRHNLANVFTRRAAKQEAQQQIEEKRKVNDTSLSSTGNSSSAGSQTQNQTGDKGTTAGNAPPSQQQDASRRIELSAIQQSTNVVVTAKLYGYSEGTCSLSVKAPNGSNAQSAQILFSQEFSTCAGFNVPVNSVGKGSWIITLTVNSAGITSTKATTLEVT